MEFEILFFSIKSSMHRKRDFLGPYKRIRSIGMLTDAITYAP